MISYGGSFLHETVERMEAILDRHRSPLPNLPAERAEDFKDYLKKRRKQKYDRAYRQRRRRHYAFLMRQWRQRHPEETKEIQQTSYRRNAMKRSVQMRHRYHSDSTYRKAKNAADARYREAHREELRAKRRAYDAFCRTVKIQDAAA